MATWKKVLTEAQIDTDTTFGSASNALVPSQLAVKTYVDAQVDTADSVSELGDTTITSIADHDVLAYDGATSKWLNMSASEAGVQATITGGATTIASSDLTASRALTSNGSGKVEVSAVTSTELGYLDGVSSAIQTQMNAKAPIADPSFTGTVTCVDLTVTGTTTTLKTQNVEIEDKIITLGVPSTGSSSTTNGDASGITIDTTSTVTDRPTFQWKKDKGGGNTDGAGTANYLTGWLLSNHRTSNQANHGIAIMDFKDDAGAPSGNSAGVGSFTYNTNEDALYLRTA